MARPWMKYLLRAAAFLLVLLLAVQAAGHFVMPTSNRYLSGYTAGGEDAGTIDVLVMGDSNAAQGITPMQWYLESGITGYTYGEGWLSVYKIYYRLRQILKAQQPRVLVLCTSTVYSHPPVPSDWHSAVYDVAEEIFPLLRFHDEWKVLTPQEWFSGNDYTWRDVNKGFMPITEAVGYGGGDYMTEVIAPEPIPLPMRHYLDKVTDLCAERGITLVFITVPTTNWNRARHDGIQAYAEGKGLPYIDFNLPENSAGLDWSTDTADGGTHLNVRGAQHATAALGQYLREHYFLPDHRGEPGYEDWDKDAVAYAEALPGLLEKTGSGA